MEMGFSCTSTAISISENSSTGTRLAEESSVTHKETYTRERFIKVTSLAMESTHLQASERNEIYNLMYLIFSLFLN